jgi:hypothetical protein
MTQDSDPTLVEAIRCRSYGMVPLKFKDDGTDDRRSMSLAQRDFCWVPFVPRRTHLSASRRTAYVFPIMYPNLKDRFYCIKMANSKCARAVQPSTVGTSTKKNHTETKRKKWNDADKGAWLTDFLFSFLFIPRFWSLLQSVPAEDD